MGTSSFSGSTRPRRHVGDRLAMGLLHSPLHGVLDDAVCELDFVGRRTGRPVTLPVMYARTGDRVVVLAGAAPEKKWWRNFVRPHAVTVRIAGEDREGIGRLTHGKTRFQAVAEYRRRHPEIAVTDTDELVIVDLLPVDGWKGDI